MKPQDAFYPMILLFLAGLALAACSNPTPPVPTETAVVPTFTLTPAPTMTPTAVPTVAQTATPVTFTDPFAYCSAIGQIDAPDSRYTGPKMSAALFKDYLVAAGLPLNGDYPDVFKQMTIWRCMDNQVYACNFGANIPCDSKANTDKSPSQAIVDYCKANPAVDFIPMVVTGHNMIYSWSCVKGLPVLGTADKVDAAGYQVSFWTLIKPGN